MNLQCFCRAALSAREPARKDGKAYHVGELAREYGFTDIDGRRVPPFRIRGSFVQMVNKQNPAKG
jgi:hypothetical protein